MLSKTMPFVVVQFHQPLDEPMSFNEAAGRVGDWLQESVNDGRRSFVAFAEGERLTAHGEMEEVMIFLMYTRFLGAYTVFENWTDEFEPAVLIDGGVLNNGRLLPPIDALAQWITGFLAKNEACPGSHRLRYRLIAE